MTRDKQPHPLHRLLDERHAQGGAVRGGRLLVQNNRLVYAPYESPQQRESGRQAIPTNEQQGDLG